MRSVSKALRFPLGGVAKNLSYRDTTYPNEESVYSAPMAVNVVGECVFSSRLRGGSRPGLTTLASQPETTTSETWLWPNGDTLAWNASDVMTYNIHADPVAADGAKIIDQHETFTLAATKGALPENCTVMAMYRDRMVVAKDNLWFASRIGDHGDFDYGGEAEDPTRAVAGQIAYAGRQGENITALIPIGDSRLYIATARRLCVMSEDPTSGISTASENVGIISRDAWCRVEGVIYFMGSNGLYEIGGEGITLVSQKLPDDLKGLDSAVLIYDPNKSGVHIFAEYGTTHVDYFYDVGNRAFWPMSYSTTIRPVGGGNLVVDGINEVVFKCADGNWRHWSESVVDDGATTMTSKVAIGPFKCGTNDDVDGMLAKMTVTLANSSANVTVSGYMGKSAEAALNAAETATTADFSFTASAGFNLKAYPRCRGAWCVLVLSATGRWAYESILADIKILGGLRHG